MATVADLIVRALVAHDVRTIYCLPGIQLDHFFNAIYDARDSLRAVHTRHEQGAAYMALGAALATGNPSAYAVVPGPGFLNTTAALATAYATNARVLCLAGQIPGKLIDKGFGVLHEIPDQIGILGHLTKSATRIDKPEQTACRLATVFQQLFSGRPRPVGLEVPPDVLSAAVPDETGCSLEAEAEPEPDQDAIRRAAQLLASSKRPMIFVGSGAIEAAEEIRLLAERLQAPVVAYRMGRGILDDRHPLSLTVTGAHRLWRDADVVLAVGTRLQIPQMNWGVDDDLNIVRVEIDPAEAARIRQPAVALIGRSRKILAELANEVDHLAGVRESRTEEMLALKADVARDIAVLEPQLSFLHAIRTALPENGILVDDLTQLSFVARFAYPVYKPRTYICSGYQGTLGWGFAAALGAQDARRDVPVVAVCGDGGFMFNVQELATAAHHNIPLVTVVFNDNAYGNVKRMQQELYGDRVIASDLTNPDFVRLAESFGVRAARVDQPAQFKSTLDKALAAREPMLIEIPCGPMPDPFPFFNLPQVRGRK